MYFSVDVSSYECERVNSIRHVFNWKLDLCTCCQRTGQILFRDGKGVVEIVVRATGIIKHILLGGADMEGTVAPEQGCVGFYTKRSKMKGGRKSIITTEGFTTSGLQKPIEIVVSNVNTTTSITNMMFVYNIKPFPFIL